MRLRGRRRRRRLRLGLLLRIRLLLGVLLRLLLGILLRLLLRILLLRAGALVLAGRVLAGRVLLGLGALASHRERAERRARRGEEDDVLLVHGAHRTPKPRRSPTGSSARRYFDSGRRYFVAAETSARNSGSSLIEAKVGSAGMRAGSGILRSIASLSFASARGLSPFFAATIATP